VEKHAGSAKRSVMIKAGVETVWKKLSEITKLGWLEEQKSTRFLSQKKYGVGAIRLISFEDGSDVEEHIVEWSPKKCFSYIAITGLPKKLPVAESKLHGSLALSVIKRKKSF